MTLELPPPASGVVRQFRHVEAVRCSTCSGSGRETSDAGYDCDCGTCGGTGSEYREETGRQPLTDDDRRFFADQGAKMTRAEELACEALRRLAPWDDRPPIVMRGNVRPEWELVQLTWQRVPRAIADYERHVPSGGCDHVVRSLEQELTRSLQTLDAAFDDAVRRELVVPGAKLPLAGRRFAELANPFAPLLEIRRAGYLVHSTTNDKFVELYAFAT